jgi:Raf kinase inhibitor-like YbhB/YbcL family protein
MLVAVVLAMTLQSTTFAPNATVPQSMVATDCGGKNVAPELHWNGAPSGAKSLALVMHDPDAPRPGGFDHWVFYDVPASATNLAAGGALSAHQTGTNGTGSTGYYGPCPPPGKPHHYIFTLYALDTMLRPSSPLDAATLQDKIKGHVLAHATLTGIYGR